MKRRNKFLESVSSRYGFESLYYHQDHVRDDGFGDLRAGADLPWYAGLSRFVSVSCDKVYWMGKILSFKSGWCRYDDDYALGISPKSERPVRELLRKDFLRRTFYTFKCVICMFLCFRRHIPDGFFEYINVAVFDIRPADGEYSGENWDAVAVGYGVFENWYFWQYSDSSY